MNPRVVGPTVDQWLDELSKLTKKRTDPGMSSREMGDISGMTVQKIRTLLGEAHRAGRLVLGWRTEYRTDGRATQIPVYRILSGEKRVAAKKRKP
jgi:hypothetical protein